MAKSCNIHEHMANKDSAKKAMRSGEKQRVFNLRRKRTMKDVMKSARELISKGDKKAAAEILPTLYKAVDKAAKRGVIKKNTAARKKSRITRAVDGIK